MVGCLYIADFPAWARQSQRPGLSSVAVYNQGVVIARSRFLSQAGLSKGSSLARAQTLFPDALFFEQDPAFERAIWERVIQDLNATTPFLLPLTNGHVLFCPHSFSEICTLTESLRVRVGLAPDRSIAQLAAMKSAPGSVLKISPSGAARFLTSTGVCVLVELGYDVQLVDRLRLFGLNDLTAVGRLSAQQLDAQFGKPGLRLYSFLHPDKSSARIPLFSSPATISASIDLDPIPIESLRLEPLLHNLVERVSLELGLRRSRWMTLCLVTSMAQNGRLAQRIFREPLSATDQLYRAAGTLLPLVIREGEDLSCLKVSLGGLCNASVHQGSLFFERPTLHGVLENLDARFPGSARRAVITNPDAPFPEDAVQFLPFTAPLARR